MKKYLLISIFLLALFFGILIKQQLQPAPQMRLPASASPSPNTNPAPKPTIQSLPEKKTIMNTYHIYQTFNNCGPAALSMALSYYDIKVSQKILADSLRPFQIINGDNDDKSVTLAEMAEEAGKYGLSAYHRPNGSIELIKKVIANDMPIIARTNLTPNDDIGHFRVVKGYDSLSNTIIQDDSMQGKDLIFSAADFDSLWKVFNYEFLVLVSPNNKNVIEEILGDNADEKKSWEIAAENAKKQYIEDDRDIYAHFNRSVSLYHIGKFEEAAVEFESVESQLPKRHLWYQIEPILTYYELNNFDRIFSLSDRIIENGNRAFAELYVVRARAYIKTGNINAAKKELNNAIYYNKNLSEATDIIKSL